MELEIELNSASAISTYNCTASYSSHFVGLLAKIAKEYGVEIAEKIEINKLEHIAFYPDEIVLSMMEDKFFIMV